MQYIQCASFAQYCVHYTTLFSFRKEVFRQEGNGKRKNLEMPAVKNILES